MICELTLSTRNYTESDRLFPTDDKQRDGLSLDGRTTSPCWDVTVITRKIRVPSVDILCGRPPNCATVTVTLTITLTFDLYELKIFAHRLLLPWKIFSQILVFLRFFLFSS